MVDTKKTKAKKSADSSAASLIEVPEDGIGGRIREAREALGLTQTGLATRTKISDVKGDGIARTVIVGYESGTHKPGAREIRILCETLNVTPNWLLYRKETPFEAIQASMHFMKGGDEVVTATRLALAVLSLKPHERDLVAGVALSIAGRELGDARLSGLLLLATMIGETVREELKKHWGGADESHQSISSLIDAASREMTTNWGNKLRFDEEGNPIGGEWLYPDPSPETTKD